MNREQILERVSEAAYNKVNKRKDRLTLRWEQVDKDKRTGWCADINDALDAAGYFELWAAVDAFRAAIAKITGDTP
jgi:hypothetical protein